MLLKKWVGLLACAGVSATVAAAGCSSTPIDPGVDGGGTPEAGPIPDVRPDRPVVSNDASDAQSGKCSPQNVTNPSTPTPAYKAYRRTASCSDAQLAAFYTACVDDAATQTTCQAWENANTACDDCLITPATDATWGPIVIVGSRDAPFNIAGCFGITLNEGSNVAACGGARWAFDRCLRSACPIANCYADPNNPTPAEDTAYNACTDAAAATTGPCAAPTADLNTKCAALDTDAMSAVLDQNCPLGDTVSLQAFTVAITKTFCGGGDGGAGGDAGGGG